MNKIIKYRAWDEEIRQIVYPHKIDFNLGYAYYFDSNEEIQRCETSTLMQSTGLQDKNGVSIYEGDIVGDKKSWSIVIWCDKCIGWQYAWYDFDLGEKICHMCKGDFDITETFENGISCDDEKVIGNLYENPELLDKD